MLSCDCYLSLSTYHAEPTPDSLISWWVKHSCTVAYRKQGGLSATPDSEKFAKIRKKRGKIRKREEKSGRKGKNREGSFTLPLLTDRAGFATAHVLWPTQKVLLIERQSKSPWILNTLYQKNYMQEWKQIFTVLNSVKVRIHYSVKMHFPISLQGLWVLIPSSLLTRWNSIWFFARDHYIKHFNK